MRLEFGLSLTFPCRARGLTTAPPTGLLGGTSPSTSSGRGERPCVFLKRKPRPQPPPWADATDSAPQLCTSQKRPSCQHVECPLLSYTLFKKSLLETQTSFPGNISSATFAYLAHPRKDWASATAGEMPTVRFSTSICPFRRMPQKLRKHEEKPRGKFSRCNSAHGRCLVHPEPCPAPQGPLEVSKGGRVEAHRQCYRSPTSSLTRSALSL